MDYDKIMGEGVYIGEGTPCAETKWSYFKVYRFEGVLYAIVFEGGSCCDCHEIIKDESKIGMYIH